MKTVVAFQGGGALGAFGCGAWSRLAPWLQERGDVVVALAGGSIGAINAAVVAHHLDEPDWGVDALEQLWREDIATPSCPFFGWSPIDSDWGRWLRSWNGFMSAVLVGNRALYVPHPVRWNPWHGLQRIEQPLFDRQRMRALLSEAAPGYASQPESAPLLAVCATELIRGELHLFDSDAGQVEPVHLLASAAIPLLFEPICIGDGLYCDGEMVRQSMLRPLIERVRSSGRVEPGEPLQLVTIEQLPKVLDQLPSSGVEISYRVFNLLQLGKLAPSELDDSACIGRWIRIAREPLPHDAVSGQFDYSPERVDELIAQADEVAGDALDGLHDLALTHDGPAAQPLPKDHAMHSTVGPRPVTP